MDDKVARALTKALQDNTKALQDHAKLLQAVTGKKAPPRSPESAQANVDPFWKNVVNR